MAGGPEDRAAAAGTEREEHSVRPAEGGAAPERGRTEYRGVRIWATVLIGLAAAIALLVFVAQNTDQVTVEWTVWKVDVSLAAVVFGAMILGAVIALVAGFVWRFQRRRRLRERQELKRLRHERGGSQVRGDSSAPPR